MPSKGLSEEKGPGPRADQGRHLEEVRLCCLRGCNGHCSTATGLQSHPTSDSPKVLQTHGFTLVSRGSKRRSALTSRRKPEGCEVKNRFSLLESQDEDEDGPRGLTDSEDEEELKVPVRVKRWSHNASQRKSDRSCNNINLLQEVRGSSINGAART